MGDEEFDTEEGMSIDLTQPHALVRHPSLEAASTNLNEHERLEGNELGDDTISCASSVFSSTLNDEMASKQLIPLDIRESDSMSDFLGVLPDDLASYVLSFLEVGSLCEVCLVSRQARILAAREDAGWRMHCRHLWSRKTFVLREARDLLKSGKAMNAYKLSIHDSNSREEIRPEELCFDAEGTIWGFRFKESAGSIWTSLDPWWTGGNPRKMVFLRDGTVKQIVQSHDLSQFALYPPFHDVDHGASRPLQDHGMTWRFVERPMDLPERARGSYIRITVDGREVPTYVVRRSQTGDWGFVMESCWGVYSMTPLTSLNVLASQNRRIGGPRMRLRRTQDGARWMNVDGIETDSEDEEIDEQMRQSVDANFTISTRGQWREALLYNFGATSLPEGEHAKAEFDRVWSQSFR
ncbi:Ubiquitination target receptor [Fragilaria crotonensis]|nr:Ubiquitination target receptor [Fragilaria crotonensis]